MRADVVGERRMSVERQARGRVEVDKVGSDRLAFTIETALAQRDPADNAESREPKQNPRIGARPFGVEPGAVGERRRGRWRMSCRVVRRLGEPLRLTPAGLMGA
jgi:hypothetical protein